MRIKWSLAASASIACLMCIVARQANAQVEKHPASTIQAAAPRDGSHDFDFEIGTWRTRLKRLLRPLTGSTAWVDYEGRTVVRKVWGGLANLVELDVGGPSGRIEALSLRLYNPEKHQWSLNFANSASGTVGLPSVGSFTGGDGEFFSQETIDGRDVLVRFSIAAITTTSCHFEQSYSQGWGQDMGTQLDRGRYLATGRLRGSQATDPFFLEKAIDRDVLRFAL